jgi:hypothetical protein
MEVAQDDNSSWGASHGWTIKKSSKGVRRVAGRGNELAGVVACGHSHVNGDEDQEMGWEGLCGFRPAAHDSDRCSIACVSKTGGGDMHDREAVIDPYVGHQ